MRGSFWPKEYTFEEYKKLYPHIINENQLIHQYNIELNIFLQEQQQRKINIASNIFQTNLLGELNQIQLQENTNDDWLGSGFQVLYAGEGGGGGTYTGFYPDPPYVFNAFPYPYPDSQNPGGPWPWTTSSNYVAPYMYYLELKQLSGSESDGMNENQEETGCIQETGTPRIAHCGVFKSQSDSLGQGFTSMTAYIGENGFPYEDVGEVELTGFTVIPGAIRAGLTDGYPNLYGRGGPETSSAEELSSSFTAGWQAFEFDPVTMSRNTNGPLYFWIKHTNPWSDTYGFTSQSQYRGSLNAQNHHLMFNHLDPIFAGYSEESCSVLNETTLNNVITQISGSIMFGPKTREIPDGSGSTFSLQCHYTMSGIQNTSLFTHPATDTYGHTAWGNDIQAEFSGSNRYKPQMLMYSGDSEDIFITGSDGNEILHSAHRQVTPNQAQFSRDMQYASSVHLTGSIPQQHINGNTNLFGAEVKLPVSQAFTTFSSSQAGADPAVYYIGKNPSYYYIAYPALYGTASNITRIDKGPLGRFSAATNHTPQNNLTDSKGAAGGTASLLYIGSASLTRYSLTRDYHVYRTNASAALNEGDVFEIIGHRFDENGNPRGPQNGGFSFTRYFGY